MTARTTLASVFAIAVVVSLEASTSFQSGQRPGAQFPTAPDGREFVIRIEPPGAMSSCEFPNIQRGSFGEFVHADVRSAVGGVFALHTGIGDKPATELKIAVWCPGFGMGLLNVQGVQSSGYERTLTLSPLKSIPLAGRVLPSDDGVSLANAKLRVSYEAFWLCNFFKEQDCGVPQWEVSTDHIAADGTFRVLVPDFAADPAIKEWADGPLTNDAAGVFYLQAEPSTAPWHYRLATVPVAAEYPDLRLSPKR
jgi:hypothetical protein